MPLAAYFNFRQKALRFKGSFFLPEIERGIPSSGNEFSYNIPYIVTQKDLFIFLVVNWD